METPKKRPPKNRLTRQELAKRIIQAGVLYNEFPATELEMKVYHENWAAVRVTVSYGGTYLVNIP